MKYFIKKIYLILFLVSILLFSTNTFSKDTKIKYSQDSVSNYLLGIISVNQENMEEAFNYLNKVQLIKNTHSNYNIQFIHTLISLEKFKEAFSFSKEIWPEDEFFFEANLLLGIDSFKNKDYKKAEKYFKRLHQISSHNILFDDFLANILLSWVQAAENKKNESFEILDKIPFRYNNLKKIQSSFLHCYFDSPETQKTFEVLTNDEDFTFSRYSFFLANYLLFKNREEEARKVISKSRKKYNSNLLIKQAENFILNNESKKIKNFFNCKNPNDVIAEIFYVMANLYSGQKNYLISNFYLKISLFLNNKFLPNKTLLAENFFYQKKYKLSKKAYNSIRSVGPIYSWHASISSAIILSETDGKEYSISKLENEFNLLPNPNFENYYEFANFFKDNEYHKESIKYYSLALQNINSDHYLVPKILDRRGTSYERLGDWDKAEQDLLESLKILPNQAHVLNYLAYSWIEKRINIEKSLEMLIQATKLKENDGYIIDSLGWAYYVNKNYEDAEKFLQRAVELMPLDPIINDHYADSLWMQNKDIQARYFWKHVLSLDNTEQKIKDNISKKLIFGISKKL